MSPIPRHRSKYKSLVEPLEQRIAPAQAVITPVSVNAAIQLSADPNSGLGSILTTDIGGGSYLLKVTQGSCLVFVTDVNGDGLFEYGEITGISAGNGLRLTSFVDIHGDIVTNLNPDFTLTDADNDASNGRDGKVVLNNRIELIEMRSVTQADLLTSTDTVDIHLALSSYSIFGSIYAGAGFGLANGALGGGLVIDTTGSDAQMTKFDGVNLPEVYQVTVPEIGSIKVGSAVSGQLFSFGTSQEGFGQGVAGGNIRGQFINFSAAPGVAGADINGLTVVNATKVDIGTLQAGNGGVGAAGARGGDVNNIRFPGDSAGHYQIIAGDAGAGSQGARGGGIYNFSDLGSYTGRALLQTGRGGDSFFGVGGPGGALTVDASAPQNIYGHVFVSFGAGGAGLTGGGAGGTLSSLALSISTPAGSGVPFGQKLVSSMHSPGDIGVANQANRFIRGFDFDGDGFNDMVYSVTSQDATLVAFGDGTGDVRDNRTLYIGTAALSSAITVNDFNGDGHPDIAVASGGASMAGVRVFLSIHDPVTGFVGFSDPIFSPIAAARVDPITQLLSTPNFSVFQQMSTLESGDFDGDGAIDIAAVATDGAITMMRNVDGDGWFASSFHDAGGNPILPYIGGGTVVHASALTRGGRDFLIYAARGAAAPGNVFGVLGMAADGTLTILPTVSIGQVDTIRTISTIQNGVQTDDAVSLSDTTLEDFALVDIDGDNRLDVVVLSADPKGFLVTFQGDGAGGFTLRSDPNALAVGNPHENSGIRISGDDGLGLVVDGLVGILPMAGGAGIVNRVAVVAYNVATLAAEAAFHTIAIPDFYNATNPRTNILPTPVGGTAADLSIRAFDVFAPDPTSPNVSFGILYPTKDDPTADFLAIIGGGGGFHRMVFNGVFLTGGDGATGLLGPGGAGGAIGNGTLGVSTLSTATNLIGTGSVGILLPANASYEGTLVFRGGSGGVGYGNGGAGGSVDGFSVNYAPNLTAFSSALGLFAGDGGASLSGTGGVGGSIANFSVFSGQVFVAGNGGSGIYGGAGGSVLGSRLLTTGTQSPVFDLATLTYVTPPGSDPRFANLPSTHETEISAFGGNGGDGMLGGGAGGSVLSLKPLFMFVDASLVGQLQDSGLFEFSCTGGAGGNALGGRGGNGGSVLDCKPITTSNSFAGDVIFTGGRGGDGSAGGDGGSVRNFVTSATSAALPAAISIVAGDGGNGQTGAGGKGGSVADVTVTALGRADFFRGNTFAFGRLIAGRGGDSLGATGGAGGGLSGLSVSTTATSLALAAGRGGDGLRGGGTGGDVANCLLDSAFDQNAKLLVIAGEGGDAFGAAPTTADPLSFGGADARGGAGGSIVNLTQGQSVRTHVDLIAGNGGNTVNSGTSESFTNLVGAGGSIRSVRISGDIGNVDRTTGIKSYNNIYTNERMSDFVENVLLDAPGTVLNDSLGNVGIVVGARGRVKDANGDGLLDPSSSGSNGVLADVSASQIMSAVAGSVDRIAAIASITNVQITKSGGLYGADKVRDGLGRVNAGDGTAYSTGDDFLVGPTGTFRRLDYLTFDDPTKDSGGDPLVTREDMLRRQPVLGGKLVDGAIIGSNSRTNLKAREFIL